MLKPPVSKDQKEDRKKQKQKKASKGLVLPGKDLEKVDLIRDNLSAIPD